jgi:hypothetical protein
MFDSIERYDNVVLALRAVMRPRREQFQRSADLLVFGYGPHNVTMMFWKFALERATQKRDACKAN